MKYIKTFESVSSQKNIEKLANDILIEMSKLFFKNIVNYKDGKFLTYVNSVNPKEDVIELDKPFRGHKFFHAYTDAQIEKDQDLAKGARLSNVPKHQGAISTNYEFLQDGARKAGVGANLTYVGERSGHNLDNGFNLPSYTLVNLNGYYAPSDRLRYQLNINNLFDKTYYVSSYSDLWVQPGEPLNASISAQWKF